MKRLSFFLPLLIILLLYACSTKQPISSLNKRSTLTKTSFQVGLQNDYLVTESDLINYVNFRILEGKSRGEEVVLSSIKPIYWDSIPCLYVLQYSKGFEIIATDKRSPIPLAYNHEGLFDEMNDPTGFGGHISLLSSDIWLSLNGLLPPGTQEEEKNIQNSLDFWKIVNSDNTLINKHRNNSFGSHQDDRERIPNGFWEMVVAESEEEVYDSIPHLTWTRWHQHNIYNFFCPDDINDNDSIVKCPAGCVAIAGAQMLYFLHSKDGVPTTSPRAGICIGHVYDNSVIQLFWDHSTSTWATMSLLSTTDTCAALLVGDVGKRLHMDYGWDGSEADTEDLVDDVFSPYGWNSTCLDEYNSSVIVSSLQSGYPIVCAGKRDVRGVEKKGHAFLVDRYKRTRTRTRITWRWVDLDDDPTNNPILLPPDDEITYSTPHIYYYGMNWGQGPTSYNNTWCTLSGIWQYGSWSPYIYNRKMIYNFTIKE